MQSISINNKPINIVNNSKCLVPSTKTFHGKPIPTMSVNHYTFKTALTRYTFSVPTVSITIKRRQKRFRLKNKEIIAQNLLDPVKRGHSSVFSPTWTKCDFKRISIESLFNVGVLKFLCDNFPRSILNKYHLSLFLYFLFFVVGYNWINNFVNRALCCNLPPARRYEASENLSGRVKILKYVANYFQKCLETNF